MVVNSKAIIIDDKIDSIQLLESLLESIGEISNIKSYSDPVEGFGALKTEKPDILFLDLEMYRLSGLEILSLIQKFDIHVHVIIITAHSQKIVKAAKYGMIDYVLKPFVENDIKQSLKKYRKHQDFHNGKQSVDKFLDHIKLKIRIPSAFEDFYFSPDDIIYLEADGNYTKIFTAEKIVITSSYNLGKIQKNLPNNIFYRISRKTIINLSYLKKIDKRKRECILSINGIIIPYSKGILVKSGLNSD